MKNETRLQLFNLCNILLQPKLLILFFWNFLIITVKNPYRKIKLLSNVKIVSSLIFYKLTMYVLLI